MHALCIRFIHPFAARIALGSIGISCSLSSAYAALASEEHLTFHLLLLWIMHNLLQRIRILAVLQSYLRFFCALRPWNMQNSPNAYWNGCSWFVQDPILLYMVMQLAPFLFFSDNEMDIFSPKQTKFHRFTFFLFLMGYKLQINTLNE